MTMVLKSMSVDKFTEFTTLFRPQEGRSGVVVTLLAILELLKQSLIELVQTEVYGQIHVKAAGGRSGDMVRLDDVTDT
jgi:segregation and condensation protein A